VGGLAAALILVVGAFGVLKVVAPAPGAPVAAQATLHDLDASASAAGTVSVRTTNYALQMSVSTKGLPSAPANHFYEVWLLAPETNKMLPLGVLSPTGNGTYSISPTIMQQFSQIDVSLQVNNGSKQVLRISDTAGVGYLWLGSGNQYLEGRDDGTYLSIDGIQFAAGWFGGAGTATGFYRNNDYSLTMTTWTGPIINPGLTVEISILPLFFS
jgi:hypothetical protein